MSQNFNNTPNFPQQPPQHGYYGQPPLPPVPPKKNHTACKVVGIVLGSILLFIILITAITSGHDMNGTDTPVAVPASSAPVNPGPSTTPQKTQAPAPKPSKKAKPKPQETEGQKQAIRDANNYLSFSAFSKKGLIGQLKFDKFSTADATFAVNHIKVNWNDEAYKSAKQYLSFSGFSKQGLISQLEFDKYTPAQAEYGATKAFQH